MILRLVLLAVLLAAPVSAQPPGADMPQVTEVVIAFGELAHASLVYSQTNVCLIAGLPESCTPGLTNPNYFLVGVEVANFKIALAKNPANWQASALTALDTITSKLDAAGKHRLRHYLHLVRTVITE